MLNKIVLLWGGPGSGKDTIANCLNKRGWGHASMSAQLRVIDGCYEHLSIMSCIDKGEIVGDDIVIPTFQLAIANFARDRQINNLAFTGCFREETQVRPQINCASHFTDELFVVKFDVTDETMLSRIKKRSTDVGGPRRKDDHSDVARHRIQEFRRRESRIEKMIGSVSTMIEGVHECVVDAEKPAKQVLEELCSMVNIAIPS